MHSIHKEIMLLVSHRTANAWRGRPQGFPRYNVQPESTNNIVLAGHPGYLFNGTFKDPTSDALQMLGLQLLISE